jgi:hypothetical protein
MIDGGVLFIVCCFIFGFCFIVQWGGRWGDLDMKSYLLFDSMSHQDMLAIPIRFYSYDNYVGPHCGTLFQFCTGSGLVPHARIVMFSSPLCHHVYLGCPFQNWLQNFLQVSDLSIQFQNRVPYYVIRISDGNLWSQGTTQEDWVTLGFRLWQPKHRWQHLSRSSQYTEKGANIMVFCVTVDHYWWSNCIQMQ